MYRVMVWSVVLVWGVSFVATRVVVQSLPPLTTALLRFLIATGVLILLSRKRPILFSWHIFFAGFWGITLYFAFENAALVYTFPTSASLIVSSAPILYTLFSHLVQRRHTTLLEYLASIIAFFGVAIVILNGQLVLKINPVGDLLLLGAALSWVFYTYHVEKILNAESLPVVCGITLWGVILLIPFSALEFFNHRFTVENTVGIKEILALLYLGVVCSGIAYVFWNSGIKNVGARYTTNTIYFIPIVTAMADSLLLGNIPNGYTISGAILVILGLWLFNRIERGKRSEGFVKGENE